MKKTFITFSLLLLFVANLFAAYPSFNDMTNYVSWAITNSSQVSTGYVDNAVSQSATNSTNFTRFSVATLGTNGTNYANSILNASTNFTIQATNSLASTNSVNALGTNFSSTSLRSVGTASLSVITNGSVVWYFYQTNGNPSFLTAPNGSLCTTTNGQIFVRTNGAWVGK